MRSVGERLIEMSGTLSNILEIQHQYQSSECLDGQLLVNDKVAVCLTCKQLKIAIKAIDKAVQQIVDKETEIERPMTMTEIKQQARWLQEEED